MKEQHSKHEEDHGTTFLVMVISVDWDEFVEQWFWWYNTYINNMNVVTMDWLIWWCIGSLKLDGKLMNIQYWVMLVNMILVWQLEWILVVFGDDIVHSNNWSAVGYNIIDGDGWY